MSLFSPRKIVQELSRRRLFNTVALYVVGAWVTLQVTELALPGLGIPDVAIRHVWIGAFILFPLVLVFAWRYDISSGGIKRTASTSTPQADRSLRHADYWIVSGFAAITVAVIGATLLRISRVEPDAPLTTLENSIAVLPFDVCAGQSEDRVLARGLSNEVMNRLSERGRFKVFARTSTGLLASLELPVAQLARELGAEYVLGGELCREKSGQLVLAAELFDRDGFVVWGQNYVEEVNRWDQITVRLARQVSEGAAARLGDTMSSPRDLAVNKIAVEQNLIGWEFLQAGDSDKAREAFERAVEAEPSLAHPKFGLAWLEIGGRLQRTGSDVARGYLITEEALALARGQLEANDRDADAHFIAGRITQVLAELESETLFRKARKMDDQEVESGRKRISTRYAEAEHHYRSTITLNPSNTMAYVLLSETIEQQGVERRSEALEILEQTRTRDPFHYYVNVRIAKRWAARGQFRQAIELLDRFKALPEMPSGIWWWQLELMQLQTHWDEKAATLVDMLLNHPDAFSDQYNRWQAWWFVSDLAHLGLHEEAEAWKERLQNVSMPENLYRYGLNNYLEAVGRSAEVVESEFMKVADMSDDDILDAFWDEGESAAYVLAEQGHIDRAIALMESLQHAPATWSEREPDKVIELAVLYLEADRKDAAIPLLQRMRLRLESEYADGIRHPQTLDNLAKVHALLGSPEQAIEYLGKAVDYHLRLRCVSPGDSEEADFQIFGTLRSDPRYIELCDRMQADLDLQANRIRRLLAAYDPDELLAPLTVFADPTRKSN